VTIPAGTDDAPHSVFAVGGSGSVAAASIDIVMPPVRTAISMHDVNGNGKVDEVRVTFDQTLSSSYTAGVAPWTLANVPSGGSLSSVSVSGNVATLTLADGPGAASTAVGSFTVALAANSAGIRDVNNHPSSFAAVAPTDAAVPAVIGNVMQDSNGNGKVDRVVVTFSEALVSYTAGTAPWSLANVPSAGTLSSVSVVTATGVATLTITEGAGATDTSVGSFTVTLAQNANGIRDAAGNRSSFSQAPSDGARPIRRSSEMHDDDGDGKIDRILVVYSEALQPFTADVSNFTLANAPSGATVASVTTSGANATLALNEGTGAANTAVGTFTVAHSANAGGIRDAAGNQAVSAAAAPTDKAAPALVTLTLLDSTGNGKVDRVTAVFSETLSATTLTSQWTLANVPSAGTLASVSRSGATVTLVLTEGTGAQDTAVGSMTVALATNASGVRDAANNLSSFTARSPADGARPYVTTVTDTNGATNGRAESGDSVVITFTEALDAGTVPSSASVILTDPAGSATADTITIAGILNGARNLTGASYVTADGSASFDDSAIALSNGDKTVTITLGTCSGSCASVGTQTANANFAMLAATTLRDTAGNAPVTTSRNFSMRMF
jgi:hypothetical protein